MPTATSSRLRMAAAPHLGPLPERLSTPTRSMTKDDLAGVLHSEQLPLAVRFALKLQRLGCAAELEYVFSMGCTLWLQHAASSPEAIAREEWAAWPPQRRNSSTR